MKVVVASFNQEKALVGSFSVIVQFHRLIIYSTSVDVESVGGADTHTGDPCYCTFTSQTLFVFYDTCIILYLPCRYLVKVGKMTSVFTAAMNEVISRYLYIYTSTVVRCMDGGDWPQPRVTMQVF